MNIDVTEFCQTLVADAPDAIIFADAEGLVRYWNHGAERLFGFSKLDAIGQTLDIIIPASLRKRHWEGYTRTIQTGLTRYGEATSFPSPRYGRMGAAYQSSSPSFRSTIVINASAELPQFCATLPNDTKK